MEIKQKNSLSSSQYETVLSALSFEAKKARDLPPMKPFAFTIEENEKLQGAISGFTYYGCLYIDTLWLAPALRNKGLGTQLIQKSEELAKREHCRFVTVNTMDWEALPFYKKLGYNVEFVRNGYEKNSKLYFLKKLLTTVPIKKPAYRIHAGVGLAIIENNQVLLMRRANTGWGDGFYSLPGGSIDGEESLRRAIVREAKEEIGIDIYEEDLELANLMNIAPNDHNPHELLFFTFVPRSYRGKITNCEPHKCDDIAFFPIDDLPENLLPVGRRVLGDIRTKTIYDEVYWNERLTSGTIHE